MDQSPNDLPVLHVDFEVVTRPYFSAPNVTTVVCKIPGCMYRSAKSPSGKSGMRDYMAHWHARHRKTEE